MKDELRLAETILVTRDYRLLEHILEESKYLQEENGKLSDVCRELTLRQSKLYEWNTLLTTENIELKEKLKQLKV